MITTERLILRRPEGRDWPQFRAFCMSERADMFPSMHGNLFAAFQGFTAHLGHWDVRGYGLWAVTRKGDDTAIGLVGPFYPEGWPETEIGWIILDPAAEGTGVATEAARAAIADAYDRLGWETIVHYIRPDNARSIALAEKLGSVLDSEASLPKPDQPGLAYRHVRDA